MCHSFLVSTTDRAAPSLAPAVVAMDDRKPPPPPAAPQASLPQVSLSPSCPPFAPHHIPPHVVKGHVKKAQGLTGLPYLNHGDEASPSGPPASPRERDTASCYPCLTVGKGHVKHIQGPRDLLISVVPVP